LLLVGITRRTHLYVYHIIDDEQYVRIDGMAPGELAYVLDLGSNGERALVVCDLMFNIPKAPSGNPSFPFIPFDNIIRIEQLIRLLMWLRFIGLDGVILRVFGSVGPLGVTRMGRWTFVKDQPAMASWMRRISDGRVSHFI
jgi:hypothetical protein